MNKSEIIACAFESWYSKFEDITINRYFIITKLTFILVL